MKLFRFPFEIIFYASTGRSRKYSLQALLWALIIQHILTFLAYSKPLRDFCGFTKVPDASKITRFKQDFLDAAFDTVELYKNLLTGDTFGDNKYFTKSYIPLNARSGLENQDYTYKIRIAVERDINHIKDTLCLAGRRTQNEKNITCRLNSRRYYTINNCYAGR